MPAVLGGGLGGLSAAYYLTSKYVGQIKLIEKSSRLGGWVKTELHPKKQFMFEFGPHTIRPKGIGASSTFELIENLGLENELYPIYSTSLAAKNRMIYVNHKLYKLPSSFTDMFRIIPPFSKPLINGIFNDIQAPRVSSKNDESIYDFVNRRFGPEVAEYAISAMICGICAGDAKEISVRFLMNDLFEKEQNDGSVIKGIIKDFFRKKKPKTSLEEYASRSKDSKLFKMAQKEKWSVYSFKNGVETLTKALAEDIQLKGVNVVNNAECSKINFNECGAYLSVNGKEIETDHVISAVPSFKLAQMVELSHPSLACQLKTIPYVSVGVVNLRFSKLNLIDEPAFGFLIPPIERIPILGVIYDSCSVKMHGTVLTVMMGGKWFEEYFGREPTLKDLLDVALEHVRKILKIKEEPKEVRVNILKECIPQYTVGHRQRVASIREYIKRYNLPLTLCGAAYDGVGVNDVILSAKTEVFSLVEK